MKLQDNKENIINQIRSLNEDTNPLWGMLTASELIVHLSEPFQIALKERPLNFTIPAPKWLVKWIVIYSPFPWPKGTKAPEDYLTLTPSEFHADKETLISYLDKFINSDDLLEDHSAFGKMSKSDWDYLLYRHFLHHFKQFRL